VLNYIDTGKDQITLYKALSRWFFARGSWILTNDREGFSGAAQNEYDETYPRTTGQSGLSSGGLTPVYFGEYDYVKVVTQGDFTPERLEGALMAQLVTIEFETVKSYDT
jgi:hypothetical protein